ncbi:MAG: FAD-dependent oxidoreductase [Devosia sp.]|nr:FAD-dependent oxidoreductase [Devosia sp.]
MAALGRSKDYDVIVVGGGSAGSAAASRLVTEAGARVLLIESGGSGRHPFFRMPAGVVRLMVPGSPHYRSHLSTPQAHLDGRVVEILQANVLGGGSSVNAMSYTRGTRADYDGWDAMLGGGTGWDWESLLPVFKRHEANQRLGAPHHGTDGPLKVSDPHHPISLISRAFLLALQEKGLPFTSDFNGGETFGAGVLQQTTYLGERWSAARAFLSPNLGNPNLDVVLDHRVTRILIENGRAVGVEYARSKGGEVITARAQDVILTAGSFVSPQLLLLSGIGPAEELQSHGIPVAVDLPGVGQGIQDHYDARLTFETFGNPGYHGQDRGFNMIRNGLQYVLFRSGPVASTGSEVSGFNNPLNPGDAPSMQYYCLGRLPSYHAADASEGTMLIANLVATQSRGQLGLTSSDPRAPLRLDLGWLSDPADLDQLVAGVEFLLDTASATPLRSMLGRCLSLPKQTNRAAIVDFIRRRASTNWHPVSSCRMGRDDDPLAVVDAQLRVRGVENLRIFDGSIMPRIVGANTNAPIMAIAERGVDLMTGRYTPAKN